MRLPVFAALAGRGADVPGHLRLQGLLNHRLDDCPQKIVFVGQNLSHQLFFLLLLLILAIVLH